MAAGLQRLAGLGGDRKALRKVLAGLEVVKAIRFEEEEFAFGFLTIPDPVLPEGRNIAILVELVRRGGGWKMTALQSNGDATSRRNEYSSGSHICGTIALAIPDRAAALAAMCDPALTRVETVASDGTSTTGTRPSRGSRSC